MKNDKQNANTRKKENVKEAPLFPYRPVVRAGMDGLEQAQVEFVLQAGQPSKPPDVNPEDK